MRAVDLFCGAGGLSCGFEWAGGEVVAGVDFDAHAARTFAANHPGAETWVTDIRQLDPHHLKRKVGAVDVVLGGPMCQGVSQRGHRDPYDERNFAFWAFADFVRELKPAFFLMENVSSLVSDVHNRGLAISIFRELESLGYHLSAEVVNAAWFGVPQLRYRLVVVGSKRQKRPFPHLVERGVHADFRIEDFTNVEQAIFDLPAECHETDDRVRFAVTGRGASAYARMCRRGARGVHNHWTSDTSKTNLRRIHYVNEGGNWHDIPARLLPHRFKFVRQSDHTTTYRRLHRGHPAHTITTECGNVTSGAYTHPVENRAISVREAARLQGFPDTFQFYGPKSQQYRQVGNAVPPLMAKILIEEMIFGIQPEQTEYFGRISCEVLESYRESKLPFTIAPRYRPLFGKSSGVLKRLGIAPQGAFQLD